MRRATAAWPADRVDTWTNGPVGLVVWRIASPRPATPQPAWPLHAQGGATIAAAARLDHRADLLAALDLDAADARAASDDALILAAWDRWGESCVARLDGAFTFVIWDEARQTLFAARDHAGVRPLSYYIGPDVVAIASDRAALLAVADVPRRIDEVRIASFLVPGLTDRARTFYEGVSRLPGGHQLSVTRTGATTEAYWRLDPAREFVLESDDAYAEVFRGRFDEAVRQRLAGPGPIAAALSGGLDSSSVVAVAANLLGPASRLHTISAHFPTVPSCNEDEYIDAVIRGHPVERHDLRADLVDPLGDLEAATGPDDDSFHGLSYYMHGALYDEARRFGARIVLEGMGGDVVVSHGSGYLHGLARHGRLAALWREGRRTARRGGYPVGQLVRRALRAGAPAWLRTTWETLGRGHVAGPWMVTRAFARRVALDDRRRAAARAEPSSRGLDSTRHAHWQALESPNFANVLEATAAMAAVRGVDVRDPFMDRRLIEFCLALPASQKVRDGRTRVVLRHAFEGRLPPAILVRGKARLNLTLGAALAAYGPERLARLEHASIERLAPYMAPNTVRHVYREARERPSEATRGRLWRLATLTLWLARSAS